MPNRITAQEWKPIEYGVLVQTKCPVDEIEMKNLEWLAHPAQAGLRAGDKIVVQAMDHYYQELLAEREFRVQMCREVTQTSDEFNQPVTRTGFVVVVRAVPETDWVWYVEPPKKKKAEAA